MTTADTFHAQASSTLAALQAQEAALTTIWPDSTEAMVWGLIATVASVICLHLLTRGRGDEDRR